MRSHVLVAALAALIVGCPGTKVPTPEDPHQKPLTCAGDQHKWNFRPGAGGKYKLQASAVPGGAKLWSICICQNGNCNPCHKDDAGWPWTVDVPEGAQLGSYNQDGTNAPGEGWHPECSALPPEYQGATAQAMWKDNSKNWTNTVVLSPAQ